jgi:hypothetical protein
MSLNDEAIIARVMGQAYEVLDQIIGPMCGIEGIVADCYEAGIDCYCNDDEELENRIIEEIRIKYALGQYCTIDAFTPLALIALLIIDKGGRYGTIRD